MTDKKNPEVEWGFYAITPRIIRTQYKQLSHTEKWLYTCLKDLCGAHGTCYRTLKSLSQETDLSTGSLSTGIRNLHNAGLIHAEKKRRSNKPTQKEVWHITIVDIWQSNAEYCSNFERFDDNVQNLNNNVQNLNDPSVKRSKFEQQRSKFEHIRIYNKEYNKEEITREEDSLDESSQHELVTRQKSSSSSSQQDNDNDNDTQHHSYSPSAPSPVATGSPTTVTTTTSFSSSSSSQQEEGQQQEHDNIHNGNHPGEHHGGSCGVASNGVSQCDEIRATAAATETEGLDEYDSASSNWLHARCDDSHHPGSSTLPMAPFALGALEGNGTTGKGLGLDEKPEHDEATKTVSSSKTGETVECKNLEVIPPTREQIERQWEARAKQVWAIVERALKVKYSATQRKYTNNTEGMDNLIQDGVSDEDIQKGLQGLTPFWIAQFNLKKFHEMLPGLLATHNIEKEKQKQNGNGYAPASQNGSSPLELPRVNFTGRGKLLRQAQA